MKPSICIFGCGEHANRVFSEKDQTSKFDLYFASRDQYKAEAYSNKFKGVGFFGNYVQALTDNRVNAAYFLTPHDLHLPHLKLAAENGKHVLMEKPIARNIKEAQKMIGEANRYNIKLMVAENYRYLPTIKTVKEILNKGIIGDIRSIEIESKGFLPVSGWRLDRDSAGGGRFIDGGIHYIDILLNLGGFPKLIYAQATHPRLPNLQSEDTVIMLAKMPNNLIGLINYSNGTPQNERYDNVLISGTTKQLHFNPFDNKVVVQSTKTTETIRLNHGGTGFTEMLSDFHEYITGQSDKPTVSNEDAIKDLAAVLATYESISKSIPINPKSYLTNDFT